MGGGRRYGPMDVLSVRVREGGWRFVESVTLLSQRLHDRFIGGEGEGKRGVWV
jgi:hypothetical protein